MHDHVCVECGTQYALAAQAPEVCMICADDRQHVRHEGQRWTTHAELQTRLHNRVELDANLLGIGIAEHFAIPQRALLLHTDVGNILWDCVSVVTPEAVDQIRRLGGIDLIAISHPHFYAAMAEWSDAFGGVSILTHEADRDWIKRPADQIVNWRGDEHVLSPTVRLLHTPGHFPGSAALHWSGAPDNRKVLVVGDSLHVAADRRHITVMHSVPNHIPVGPSIIKDLRDRLADIDFDDVYGFTWGLNILGDARAAVDASFDRYLKAISA